MIQSGAHRSRRLRKKLHVGEFAVFGFYVDFKLTSDLSDQRSFWDAFIAEIERNNLLFGGAESGFVTDDQFGAVTADSRNAVQTWLIGRPDVTDVRLGAIIDVYHGVGV